jgi:pimeloyl-ACP methyl ester carboxylesterase
VSLKLKNNPMQGINTPFWLQSSNRPDTHLPVMHFVHGNSFPTGSYSVFLSHLRSTYQIHALEMHGHDPAFPVTDNWTELCNELIASIESRQSGPVILVGHSLGGILSLKTARMRPDLVRCVVMRDSPVVAGWRASVLRIGKLLGLARFVPPAKFSVKRRKSWPDRLTAYQHFAVKEAFSVLPEQVMRDYIQFGTEPYPNGVTLRFKRDIETAIYCSLPHDIDRFIGDPYPVPIGFLCGTTSQEVQQAGIVHTQRLVGEHFEWITGSHLYPLESPQLAAEKTHALIQKLVTDR